MQNLAGAVALAMAMILAGVTLGLLLRNATAVTLVNRHPFEQFGQHVINNLPTDGGVVLCDEPLRLLSLQAALATDGGKPNWLAVNTDLLNKPEYRQWLAQLGSFLSQFKLPGAELFFEGDKINLGGAISDADKQGLLDKLKSIFGPQFTIGWLPSASGIDLDALAKAASEKARAALSQLKPGFGAQDLISALNLTIINFATSSAQVLATDKDLIKRAADAIKAAPAGLKLEIGGHTDSTGDTAANLQLSQARAEAVRDELIQLGVSPQVLIAKGYGGTKPIASNETEAGRFQNRRIEYTIVK